MIARLLISPALDARVGEIEKILSQEGITRNHPDLLHFPADSKLGIEQARKIKEHFYLKPYSTNGAVVVLEDASSLTIEAQNALLKTLEEPPEEAMIILGARSTEGFLPTILSRCQIVILGKSETTTPESDSGPGFDRGGQSQNDVEKLLQSSIEERFEYIEKLKDREEFLHILVHYFQQQLHSHSKRGDTKFIKELLQAEEWAAQNVNIRAILEYLMLVMPR